NDGGKVTERVHSRTDKYLGKSNAGYSGQSDAYPHSQAVSAFKGPPKCWLTVPFFVSVQSPITAAWYRVLTVAAGHSMRLLLSSIRVSQSSPSSRQAVMAGRMS